MSVRLTTLIAPKHIAVEAARRLGIDAKPVSVPIHPDSMAQRRLCYFNVQRKVQDEGGEMVMGWSVTYFTNVLIDCIHHAVWRSPDGKLLDVTLNRRQVNSIMFLPDPTRTYEEYSGKTFRFALSDAPVVREFIEAPVEPRTRDEAQERENLDERLAKHILSRWAKDAPCFCGRKSSFKKCCYSQVTALLRDDP